MRRGGVNALAAPHQNPSSGGATASFDASMTRTRCRSCSPATSLSTTSKLLSANPKRRRSDTRSLRGAQKHLYACRPRGATARRWRWTLPTPPPKTTRMSERRDRRRPAGTANSNSAGRPDAGPRLNVFYIPKDGVCPKMRLLGPQKAIKRIYFQFGCPPLSRRQSQKVGTAPKTRTLPRVRPRGVRGDPRPSARGGAAAMMGF